MISYHEPPKLITKYRFFISGEVTDNRDNHHKSAFTRLKRKFGKEIQ